MTTPNSYAPVYNGTNNADDPLVTPWWIPGWTSQNADTAKYQKLANNGSFAGPGFPSNLAFVNITGNYFDTNSSPLAGYVTIMMSDNITVVDNTITYRLPQRYTGTMNQPIAFAFNNFGNERLYLRLGQLNIQVFATDQTTSGSTVTTDSGNAFFYYVTEHFLGGRTYHIQVPSASAGTAVDINSLIVPGTIGEYKYDPVFPDGNVWMPDTDLYNTLDPYTGV